MCLDKITKNKKLWHDINREATKIFSLLSNKKNKS